VSVLDLAHPYGSHGDNLEKGTQSAPIFANAFHGCRLINLIQKYAATGGRQKVDF
jgi:hypothetical protein